MPCHERQVHHSTRAGDVERASSTGILQVTMAVHVEMGMSLTGHETSREKDFILKASQGDESAVAAFLGSSSSPGPWNLAVHDFRVRGLVEAAKNGHAGVVDKILAACPNIPPFEPLDDELRLTLVHLASWTGQQHKLRQLRDQRTPTGVNVNAGAAGGITALHLAASAGHLDAVTLLLQWPGVELKVPCSDGLTALHWAANGGHSLVLGVLLDASREPARGIDPTLFLNARDGLGRTPLHHAARGGHVAAVELLLQAPEGVDVLIRDGVRESTPFLLACAMPGDNVGVVRRLLKRDAAQLHDTVGDVKVSRRVLEGVAAAPWKRLREALVHKVDEASVRTPFSPGDFELEDEADEADRWKSRGVSVGKHNALHLAASQNNAQVVDYLLQQPGIDANARDGDYGMTPLHCAVRTGAVEALKILLACKQVDVNAQVGSSGRIPRKVPLSEAGAKERDFVEGKCGRFWDGDTALHLAIRFGPSQIALQSVCELCRLTHLQPSIRNGPSGGRVTAVEVALQRWNSELVSDRLLEDKDTLLEDKDVTMAVINTVAEHRDMEMFVNRREDDKKGMQDTLNALLVAATLIAGATFQGTLQPPPAKTSAVEFFWLFNVSSFYLSMCSIITTLEAFFPPGPAASLAHLEGVTSKLRVQMAVSTLSTGLSVLMGAAAFSEASFMNSSLNTHVLLRILRVVFVGTLCIWFLFMYVQASKASPTIFRRGALLQLGRGLLGLLGRGVYRSREEIRVRNHSIKGSVSLLFVAISCFVLGWIRFRHNAPVPSPA